MWRCPTPTRASSPINTSKLHSLYWRPVQIQQCCSTIIANFTYMQRFPAMIWVTHTHSCKGLGVGSDVFDPKAFSFERKGRNLLPPASNRRRRSALMLWSISSMDINNHTNCAQKEPFFYTFCISQPWNIIVLLSKELEYPDMEIFLLSLHSLSNVFE